MKSVLLLILTLAVGYGCKKEHTRTFPYSTEQKGIIGKVIRNTNNCINPWNGSYPVIILLVKTEDGLPIYKKVYSTDLPDSFRVTNRTIKFDLDYVRDSRQNWCDGLALTEEVQLSNITFQ